MAYQKDPVQEYNQASRYILIENTKNLTPNENHEVYGTAPCWVGGQHTDGVATSGAVAVGLGRHALQSSARDDDTIAKVPRVARGFDPTLWNTGGRKCALGG